MSKIVEVSNIPGEFMHWCTGCKEVHSINTIDKNLSGAIWSYNNDPVKPTFSPSINYPGQCHYWIKEGFIEYCLDSDHALAGQTVPLEDIEKHW